MHCSCSWSSALASGLSATDGDCAPPATVRAMSTSAARTDEYPRRRPRATADMAMAACWAPPPRTPLPPCTPATLFVLSVVPPPHSFPLLHPFPLHLLPWQPTGMTLTLVWHARKERHGRIWPHRGAVAWWDGGARAARPESSRGVEEQRAHDQNRWETRSCVAAYDLIAREEHLLACSGEKKQAILSLHNCPFHLHFDG